MHLPRQAVFDRGHDEAGAAQDDLPLRPLVQLRLALPDAEDAFQQGPVLLVRVHRPLWREGGRERAHTQSLVGICRPASNDSPPRLR